MTLFRNHRNGLSEYLNAVSENFDRKCPWCKQPLELVSLSNIGMKNLSHNGLIRCTNEDCHYFAFATPSPAEEKRWEETGELPGWTKDSCEMISFETLRSES